jgi:cobyrinic acid a,c-diamide synthase
VSERRGLVLSAPASGAGKTTIALGLLRAFRSRGLDTASAKSGPDYIDPKFHEAATGRPCATLDAWAMTPDRLRALTPAAGLVVVEGAMGLFDGAPDAVRPEGRGSTADVAAALGAPVVLILDCAKQGQSAAAIAAGFAAHREDVTVAGVILNRVGSARHEAMIRRAMQAAGIAVIGAVPRDEGLALPSRHLGLVQAEEHGDLEAFIAAAAALITERLDLDALAAAALPLSQPSGQPLAPLPPLGQRIAVARDQAFAFAYGHILQGWRNQGAEIAFFSPLADQAPDLQADAIYLPGGYPELHAGTLAGAERFLAGVRRAAARGARIYGECGWSTPRGAATRCSACCL